MSDEERAELLQILNGTVPEVKADLEGKTDDQLNELLMAEEADEKTRIGVIDAIHDKLDHELPPQTPMELIEAEIDKLESQAVDIKAAARLHALRDERNELENA